MKTPAQRLRFRNWVARLLAGLLLALAPSAFAEGLAGQGPPPAADRPLPHESRIEALVREAMERSPVVAAARSHFEAETRVASQVSTLPDPEVTLQQLTVGGPKPFEGYETSDFYYTGLGVSQEIPWPGKLKLRARRARRAAEAARQEYEAARREVAGKIREAGYELFYLNRRLEVLGATRGEIVTLQRVATEQYRLGKSQQQDVLKAQLEATAVLKEMEETREELGQGQAALKALLGREIDSRDLEVGEVAPSRFAIAPERLRELVKEHAPEILRLRALEARGRTSLKLARADYVPDFSVGYMYQKTGPGFRDYYMLTLGAKIPLYFWRKQRPAVEQATLERETARHQLRAGRLGALAEAERNRIAAETQGRIITYYREGLIPQARATFDSARAAYRTGRVDFQTLLSALADLLNLNEQYYRAIADHEIAIARIRRITGEAL